MGLWGASDSDEAKPKNLSEANTAGTYNKKEVLAANSGWVQKAGTAASGNDNADAQPEVLVAIGGLADIKTYYYFFDACHQGILFLGKFIGNNITITSGISIFDTIFVIIINSIVELI